MTKFLFLFLLCVIFSAKFTNGGNILFVAMGDSASHRRSMYPMAEALAKKGHSVTFFTEIGKSTDAVGRNMTNNHVLLEVEPEVYRQEDVTMTNILWHTENMSPLVIIFPWAKGLKMTDRLFKEKPEEYKKLLDQHWDLLFVDGLFTTTGIALASQLNVPYIIYDPSLVSDVECYIRSIPFPIPTIPSLFMSSLSHDSEKFFTRVHLTTNSVLDMVAYFIVEKFMFQSVATLQAPDSTIWDFYRLPQASFVDYPVVLDYPRPATPDLVFIGGKCKGTTVLTDKVMIDWVEDPTSLGTIVLAFGHMVSWDGAPDEVKISFGKVFNKLKQYRIVWQYKGTPPVALEPHVKTMGWLPQTELLNHPKTKVFISHGGLKSVTEAVCGEVPAVVIPFFAEQTRNAFLFSRTGAAEPLHKFNLTEQNIYDTIVKVATDGRYKTSVVKLKKYFTEKPIPPTENGIFWTEFMLRHKGLPEKYFKHVGVKMRWFTYFMVDVFLVAIAATLLPAIVILKVSLKFLRKP